VINMEFVYKMDKDTVSVWVMDEKTGQKSLSVQLPRKEVDYVAKRAIKELDITEEEAYDLAVYVSYLRVTWGLL